MTLFTRVRAASKLMKLIMKASAALLALLAFQYLMPAEVWAADGSLDLSFGTQGVVTIPVSGFPAYARGVVVQPDGKLVAAGASGEAIKLVRLNPNGSLDPTFGIGGIVTGTVQVTAVSKPVLQPDGKILVAADELAPVTLPNGPSFRFIYLVARYLSNGAPDSSFGTGGMVTTDLGGSLDLLYTLALQPDGKIIAAGQGATHFLPNASRLALVRYNTNGTLDVSFGSGGVLLASLGGDDDVARSVAVLPDGKIVAGGPSDALNLANGFDDFALMRFHPDGTVDNTFGIDGRVITDFGGDADVLNAIAVQPDGRIVAGGGTDAPDLNFEKFAAARYEANGALDPTFGSGGKTVAWTGGINDSINSLLLQPDGKILAGGGSAPLGATLFLDTRIALLRLTSGGILDPAFGAAGFVLGVASQPSLLTAVDGLALQPDGKVVTANGGAFGAGFTLARFNAFAIYDKCLRDDSSQSFVQFNSTTGDYLFTKCGAAGFMLSGHGTIREIGSVLTITDSEPDRRVSIGYLANQLTGRATIIRILSQGVYLTYSINDTNIHPVCSCQ